MIDEMYHTALKSKFDTKYVSSSNIVSGKNYLFLKNDIMKTGIPSDIYKCDVVYGEPPWPHGFNVFNERAAVEDRRTYKDFARSLSEQIKLIKKPFYMTAGKTLIKLLPSNAGTLPIKLNGNDAFVVWWFDKFNENPGTNLDVCEMLAKKYSSMGDWCCGYGTPLMAFLKSGGKSVVGSDYDGKCITVCGERFSK